MNRFAVVGMGSIAKRHLANLRYLHPTGELYCVSASGKNQEAPEHADFVCSIEDVIIKRPEYVIIASPATSHIDFAEKLLQHDIPVLIEKPLSSDGESCARLEARCRQAPSSKIGVAYCLRFLPCARLVKKNIDEGTLGTIYNVNANVGQFLPSWRVGKSYKESVAANKSLGGGALLELSHELDYLRWFFGDLSLQHSWLRTSDELGLNVEDIADLVLLSPRGVHVCVHLDFIQKATQRKCEFIGERGRLVWDLIKNTVILYDDLGEKTLYCAPTTSKQHVH